MKYSSAERSQNHVAHQHLTKGSGRRNPALFVIKISLQDLYMDADQDDNQNKEPAPSATVTPTEPDLLLPQKMRRVDWRWAVAKGFLDKETNEWNQQLGGQEAYLKQRNERMIARLR